MLAHVQAPLHASSSLSSCVSVSVRKREGGGGGSTYYNIVYIQQSTQSQYHEALSLGQPATYFQFQYVQELDMVKEPNL